MEKQCNDLVRTTINSKRFFKRACQVLPGGVTYGIRDLSPHPFYVSHASENKLYDVDGNVYTDYWLGHGALLLGHAPKRVVDAVSRQIKTGTHFGYAHPREIELAELVVKMVPSAELVRFTNSGTEANMYAVRLARAHTGRTKIAKFEGGWHGGYDALHKAVHAPFTLLESAGLNPKALEDTFVFQFNELEGVKEAAHHNELACVIVEPMLGAAGFIPANVDFLESLREICDDTGTVLIFDEVITGFRLSRGGAQEFFGVTPDITVLGKILGGGFPIGGLCGQREIFERIDQRKYPDFSLRSFHGGTFTGNPVSMIAGIETLHELQNSKVYSHVNYLGEKARAGLVDIFDKLEIDAAITGLGSTFCIHFQKEIPQNAREATRNNIQLARTLHFHLLDKGITYASPTLPHLFLSTQHTPQDIDTLLAEVETFVKECNL
jgi:glutamate-1-semialdehyde 2,1-aminomutase